MGHIPHQKLLRDGLSTPITPYSLICTISSELSAILDQYQNRPRSYQPGPSWLPGSTPSIFQEAFRADSHQLISESYIYIILINRSYHSYELISKSCLYYSYGWVISTHIKVKFISFMSIGHINSYQSHIHITHMNGSYHSYQHISKCRIHMNDMTHITRITHMNAACHSYE